MEAIRGTLLGCGPQNGNSVSGSVDDTSPPHSADGRRWHPNAPRLRTESEEGASICKEDHTRLPELGRLEAYPDREPFGRRKGLVYFLKLHPMAGATDDQGHTIIGSG